MDKSVNLDGTVSRESYLHHKSYITSMEHNDIMFISLSLRSTKHF